jgi:hypothetical protein
MTDKKEMSAAEREARANIPASALRDMTAINYNAMADLKAYGFATGGPCGAIPRNPTVETASPPQANTSGWQHEVPIAPSHHVAACDRLMDAAEAQERRQAQQPADFERMMTAMAGMLQMQSQTLQALAAVILRDDQSRPKPKRAKDDRGPKAKL